MRAVLLAGSLLASCAPGAPQEARSGTIVSLNPCADAILAEIVAPPRLLAISHFSHNPRATSMPLQQARRFGKTGGTAEEIIALSPDVVVADRFLAPATRRALTRAGIQIFQTDTITSPADSDQMIDDLAALTGATREAAALKKSIAAAWAHARWDGEAVTALLWQQGGIVPGDQTLAAAMLAHAGFTLHSAALGLGQGAYVPLEQVLAHPPDVILAAGSERLLTHPVLGQLEAVRYEPFDPGLLYCGGPTIIRAMKRLSAIRQGL